MAKIMLHGNAPWVPSGYGQQLRLLGRQLRGLGHEVAYSANWGLQGAGLKFEGFDVFPAADGNSKHGCSLLPAHAARWKADLVVLLGDAWYWPADVINEIQCQVALWMPVDCTPLSSADRRILQEAPKAKIIAMSVHGLTQLETAGYRPAYIPHAYDPAVFHPLAPEKRVAQRAAMNIGEGTFAVGICAANKDGCRKGFSEQFRAFADFHAEHEDSRLLVHAVPDKRQGGIDLRQLASMLDIAEVTRFPSEYGIDAGLYSPSAVASWFQSLDILSACSWGEGFGVPVIEAQACGTPTVVTDFSAQATLPARWRVRSDAWWISAHDAWWGRPDAKEIRAVYEDAFHQLQGGGDLRTSAGLAVLPYRDTDVAERCWRPWLAETLGSDD